MLLLKCTVLSPKRLRLFSGKQSGIEPQKAMEKLMNNEKEYPVYSAEDIEKQKALDAKEKANNWQRLEEKLTSDVGEELAKETVKAFGELYELFEGGAVDWFANLFDAECGGYYYSNSARDTACFRPDLESTY